MHAAIEDSCRIIERTLGDSPAYQKVDERLYVVRQGSAYVMVSVVPWGEDRAVVHCVAQLVAGATLTGEVAMKLLALNARLRFGAFGYVRDGGRITLSHALLGGAMLEPSSLLATVRDLAVLANEFDDQLVAAAGGRRMQDLLEDEALHRIQAELERKGSPLN